MEACWPQALGSHSLGQGREVGSATKGHFWDSPETGTGGGGGC